MNSNKTKTKTNTKTKTKSKTKTKNVSQLFKLISEKKIFLALIFLNLILQHYISYYVSANINLDTPKEEEETPNKYNNIIIVGAYILTILFILLLIFVPMSVVVKFIIFSLFSVTFGIIYASLKHRLDPGFVQGSAVGTLIVFVFMILYGLALTMSGIQYTNKVAFGIFYALVLFIIVGIIQYYMYNYLVITKLVLVVLAVLFALYIVHTTNNILLRDYEGDFITASFDYYIDNSNFFYALKVDSD
jgi:FtsH-binding integral membrane protein